MVTTAFWSARYATAAASVEEGGNAADAEPEPVRIEG